MAEVNGGVHETAKAADELRRAERPQKHAETQRRYHFQVPAAGELYKQRDELCKALNGPGRGTGAVHYI